MVLRTVSDGKEGLNTVFNNLVLFFTMFNYYELLELLLTTSLFLLIFSNHF